MKPDFDKDTLYGPDPDLKATVFIQNRGQLETEFPDGFIYRTLPLPTMLCLFLYTSHFIYELVKLIRPEIFRNRMMLSAKRMIKLNSNDNLTSQNKNKRLNKNKNMNE